MNVLDAAQTVAAFLEVDSDRYDPTVIGIQHINEAMHTLSREYNPDFQTVSNNISMTQPADTATAEWLRYPGAALQSALFSDPDWEFEVVNAAWKSPYKAVDRLEEWPYEALLDYYGDDEGSAPERFALFHERLIIRPIPTTGLTYTMRFLWTGTPVSYEDLDTPPWLIHAPYGVIYRACEVASAWLLEDERIGVFNQARQEQMDGLGITKSMGLETNNYVIREP